MFRDLFNVGVSTPGGQPLDLKCSAAQILKPLSAGGQGLINNGNYDEYTNNTLAEEFSKLSLNNPPLAPISTISNLKNPESAHTTHILNDTKRQRAVGQATRQAGNTNPLSPSPRLTPAQQNTKGLTRTKLGIKGRRRRKRSPLPISIKKDLIPV
jgi:hypothetical protein